MKPHIGLREGRCPSPVIPTMMYCEPRSSLPLEPIQSVFLDSSDIMSIDWQEGAGRTAIQDIVTQLRLKLCLSRKT